MAALVGDRELREAVDLVAPEVDPYRVVRGGRVHVHDRAAHRDLAARLHLVLAPVPGGDEPFDELVAVEAVAAPHDDRFDVLDVRAEPLHERAHGRDDDGREVVATGAQAPHDAQPPPHRLGRGGHPLERQRLPRREPLDGAVSEELAQVAREPLGLRAGRHGEQQRAARRRASRDRRREDRARGVGHGHGVALSGRGGVDHGVGAEQGGQPRERRRGVHDRVRSRTGRRGVRHGPVPGFRVCGASRPPATPPVHEPRN
ncbi:MAG: hypothetical protein KatS3mg010_0163 [Acidimicrobiia bacterium]|nr:MAG: hypothetical protein KatS3mg010_0163 [Acidimicrobiia bacterium]